MIEPRDRLGESYTTIAEDFAAAGYQCAGFVSGPFLRTPHRLQQGFELWDQEPSAATQEDAHADITNPEMEERILRFLREGRDPTRPLFLFAYFWDVHYDYLPPPPYDTMFVPEGARPFDATDFASNPRIRPGIDPAELDYLVSQYDGEIRCTDDLLGRIFDAVRALGIWDRTVVVVTADHGEEFFEHGAKGHKNNLYVESVRVPLVVKWAPAGPAREERRLAGLVDIRATLAEAAGLRAGPDDGRSLAGEPRGPDDTIFQELVTTYYGRGASGRMEKRGEQWWALRVGSQRLISVPSRSVNVLYDVATDPGELFPLGEEAAPIVERTLRALTGWQARTRAAAAGHEDAGEAVLTGDEAERLRALGYIHGDSADAPAAP